MRMVRPCRRILDPEIIRFAVTHVFVFVGALSHAKQRMVCNQADGVFPEDDPSVGYIRISLFSKNTDKEFKNAVKDLKNKGCDKFILDLRDNGGGLTDISVEIADYLLPACKIMTDVTKSGSETVYNSDDKSADLKLVVLVNGNTASASEILTAALKENNAATIIGSRTYGKGVTQISRMFSDGSAAKLTVSEYLTPKGNHVNDNGIEPDIVFTKSDSFFDRKALAEYINNLK